MKNKTKEINWIQTIFVNLVIGGLIVVIFCGAILYIAEFMGFPGNSFKEICFGGALLFVLMREFLFSFKELTFNVYKKENTKT